MTYIWKAAPAPAPETAEHLGLTAEFGSQAAAEAWFAGVWPELADAGVASVSLYADGELVYGPMPLSD